MILGEVYLANFKTWINIRNWTYIEILKNKQNFNIIRKHFKTTNKSSWGKLAF